MHHGYIDDLKAVIDDNCEAEQHQKIHENLQNVLPLFGQHGGQEFHSDVVPIFHTDTGAQIDKIDHHIAGKLLGPWQGAGRQTKDYLDEHDDGHQSH